MHACGSPKPPKNCGGPEWTASGHREAADLTVYGGRQGYEHLEPQSNAEKKPQTTPRTTAEADEAERKAGRLVEWCRREYERIENS
jgi:hypothetical protein